MQGEERTTDEDDPSADPPEDAAGDAPSDSGEDASSPGRESSEESDHPSGSADDGDSGSGDGEVGDDSKEGIAAPSIGPDTEIEREPPEERLARHEQSDVDAMGNDKRRAVKEQRYGASKARQLALYGIFLGVVALLFVGALFAVDQFDKPRDDAGPTAPWAQNGVKQIEPKPIDFPRNGQQQLDLPDSEAGSAENVENAIEEPSGSRSGGSSGAAAAGSADNSDPTGPGSSAGGGSGSSSSSN